MTLAPLSVSGCLPAGNPAQLPGITPTDAGAFPITARGGHSSAWTLSRAGRASSRHTNSGQARFRAGRSPASSLFETGRGFGPGLFSRGNMMKGRSEPENAAFVVITQTAALWIGANHEYGAAE